MNIELTFTTQQYLLHIFQRKKSILMKESYKQLLLFLSLHTRSLNIVVSTEKQTVELSSSSSFTVQLHIVTLKHVLEVEQN